MSASVVSGRTVSGHAPVTDTDRAVDTPEDLEGAQRTVDQQSGTRYRLNRTLGAVGRRGSGWQVYVASDRYLRREVIVRIAVTDTAQGLERLRARIAWARALARVNDTRITRIYDAGMQVGPDGSTVGLIVTDYFPGHKLDHCAASGHRHDSGAAASSSPEADSVLAALESSLAAVHEQDLSLGAVRPADVVTTSAGPVLVALPVGRVSEIGESDLAEVREALRRPCTERAAVIADDTPPNRRAANEPQDRAVTMGSGKSAAAVRAKMNESGRDARSGSPQDQQWSGQDQSQYAASADRLGSSRRLRAGEDTQERVYGREDDFDEFDYDSASGDDGGGGRSYGYGREGMSAPKRNRFVILLGVLLGILGLVVVGWFAGLLLGKVTSGAQASGGGGPTAAPTSATSAASTSTAATTAGKPIKIVGATLFDPPPGDGQENPAEIPQAFDGNPGTFWPTLQYNSTATFGNIKKGVGIILDLGSEQTVGSVKVSTSLPNAKLEIRSGKSTQGSSVDEFPVVSPNQTLSGETDFPVAEGTKTRYLLVWVTELVPVQGKFQASISEVAVTS